MNEAETRGFQGLARLAFGSALKNEYDKSQDSEIEVRETWFLGERAEDAIADLLEYFAWSSANTGKELKERLEETDDLFERQGEILRRRAVELRRELAELWGWKP